MCVGGNSLPAILHELAQTPVSELDCPRWGKTIRSWSSSVVAHVTQHPSDRSLEGDRNMS